MKKATCHRYTTFRPSTLNTLMHLHFPSTHSLTNTAPPTLNDLQSPKPKRNSPSKPVHRTNRRTRTSNIAYLTYPLASTHNSHSTYNTYRAKANSATQKHRQRHKSSKPVHHRQSLESQQTPLRTLGREEVWEFEWYDDERSEREDGPGGSEDEEVYFRGGGLSPVG
jgi:hypothetical protein